MLAWGYNVIKQDKNGKYVEVGGNRFYIDNMDETIDDLISLINNLRQTEKIVCKYEEDDDELLIIIRKKIAYYCEVIREIYVEDGD
jgi:hypothetical protein